jgi:hypothetical protein
MVAQSWQFPTPQTISPTEEEQYFDGEMRQQLPESFGVPLFSHEQSFRRHRRTKAVSFPSPPLSPAHSESPLSPFGLRSAFSTPPVSPAGTALPPIWEEIEGSAEVDNKLKEIQMMQENLDVEMTDAS